MRAQDIRRSTTSIVAVVLAAVLVLMINWLGARHWKRADWTASNLYTLSEKSRNIVASLDEDIRVIVFMTPGSDLFPQVRELLNRYSAASARISVEYIDPDREPLRTQKLAEEFGVSLANTVVFSAGERSKYVTSDQMAEYDYGGMQYGQSPTLKSFRAEEQFTSAILSLVAPKVPHVYFISGHGEPTLGAPSQPSEPAIGTLEEALKRENMETTETTLLGGAVPEDADVVAIVGPMRAFTEAEINALDAYLERGGRLLVALDPLIEPDGGMRSTRLEALLLKWGVEVRDDLVIDPSKKLPFYDLSAVYLDVFGDHPITQGMDGLAVLCLVARSVAPVEEPEQEVTTLVETSPEGWGETNMGQLLKGEPVDPGDEDTLGPVAVAVAVEERAADAAVDDVDQEDGDHDQPPQGARLVVFGDSDFLSDTQIANAGNLVLAVNAFNWLAAQEQALGIPAHDVDQASFYLSASQMRGVLFIILLVIPGAAIVAGIFIWRRRRH